MSADPEEMTVDQLAAAAHMTVRNVRAYASRGLIPAPRMMGRTGYYDARHLSRLRLIHDLLERGYTLGAVEHALTRGPTVPDVHALELLATLADPLGGGEEPEEMPVGALSRLAGREHDEQLLVRLEELGLVERVDEDTLRLLRPFVVRAGAQAMALGLQRDAVLALLPVLSEHLGAVATRFVDEFRAEIWHPFAERAMPAAEWPEMLQRIQRILPVAGQAVVAVFRDELAGAIQRAMGEELQLLDGTDRDADLGPAAAGNDDI